jgi:hypothetical protein
MFNADDIQTRLRRSPFTPVRIVTSSGERYDVYHPDLVMVGRRYLIIGTASQENPTQFDRESRVAVLHVADLQDLPAAVQPSGSNGAAE